MNAITTLGALCALLVAASPSFDETRDVAEIVAAIDAAPAGSTVVVAPGTYAGNLVVRRSVVLDGGGRAIIDGGGEGTVVTVLAPNVTFRGFVVRGSAAKVDREPCGIRAETGPVVIEDCVLDDVLYGIDARTAPGSVIRRNRVRGKDLELGRRGDAIRLWWSHGSTVEDNYVERSRDMVFWYSEQLIVQRNHVVDSRYGLHTMYSHETTFAENQLSRNSVGIYLMYSHDIKLLGNLLDSNRGPSGYGLGLKDCDDIVVQGNRLLANRIGIYIDNTPSSVDAVGLVERNLIAFNEIGVLMTPNTKNDVIVENGFIDNGEQVAVHGRGSLEGNAFARDGRGNFWSDYGGFDLDSDGLGDLPYVSASLFADLLARRPNLRLFVHSPAQQAVEFAARALPDLRPEPKFTDPSPLMAPPVVPGHEASHQGRTGLLIFAIAALAAGTAVPALLVRNAAARDLERAQSQGRTKS